MARDNVSTSTKTNQPLAKPETPKSEDSGDYFNNRTAADIKQLQNLLKDELPALTVQNPYK